MAKKPAPRSTNTVAASAGHASAHGHDAPGGEAVISTQMDYAAHEAMYHRFTDLVKWGIVASVVLVIFLFIVIHPMVPVAAS